MCAQCSAQPDEIPSANWSKSLFRFHSPLALQLLCTLSAKALAEAVSDKQLLHYSGSAGTTALYWQPAVYVPKCINVKVLYQGSDWKKENRTSVFRVWSAIRRFLLSWTFGLNPWSCLYTITLLCFKHKLHLGLSVFPLFIVTLDDCKPGEHRIKEVNTHHW